MRRCFVRAATCAGIVAAFGATALAWGADDPCMRAERVEPELMRLRGLFDDEELHRRGVATAIGAYCVQYWDVEAERAFGEGGIRVVTVRDGAVREAYWRPLVYFSLWFDDPDGGIQVGEDISGNGLPNLVIRLITGGDCCFAMLILEFGDGVRVIYDDTNRVREASVDRVFRDLTGDGRLEIVATNAPGARWRCLDEAGIDLVTISVWWYEPTFGDERRGAYIRADPALFPEVFEWYTARGQAIIDYDGSHAFDPNDGLSAFPSDLRDFHDENPSDMTRVCRLLPLGMALVDAGRYEGARDLLAAHAGDVDAWPWSMAAGTFDQQLTEAASHDVSMFERLACPSDDVPGIVARYGHGGHVITGWGSSSGHEDLLGAVRIDLADGRSWCFARVGGYVTLAIGAGAALVDLTGSGHPDVLIQVHGLRSCEQFAYVIELGPEPRIVFEAAAWTLDGRSPHGYPVCPFALEDLDGDGRFELVTTDSYWLNPGVTLPSCSHALAPYVPVALAYSDGAYRVVDVEDPRERIGAWALGELYDAFLGSWLREYARTTTAAEDVRFEIEHRCVVAGLVLPWFYLRQPERAGAVFDLLYQLDDREAVWELVLESVRASPYVGSWYR